MPNGVEPQPQEFDVGKVVRDYQGKFLGTTPNLAMPATMIILLAELEALTAKVVARNNERGEDDQLNTDVLRWRARLTNYHAELAKAPTPDDRKAILWTVTAPLLLGWFGGETGSEVPLPTDGFPPGFNTVAHHGADVASPFTLANQLGVAEEWDHRRVDLLLEDIETEAGKVAAPIKQALATPGWGWIVGGVAAMGIVGYIAYKAGKETTQVQVKQLPPAA